MSKKAPVWTTPFGTLAYAYIAKADDQAPEGAKFTPDGKFKGTLVVEDAEDFAQLRADCLAFLRAELPDAPADEDLLALPIKAGESLGSKKAESFAGKTVMEAKSQYRPKVYDAAGKVCPEGVYAYSGDTVRFKVTPYAFKKTEKVREGKKMVEVDLFGVSLRLVSVQIKEKGGGGGDVGFDAVEGGGFDGETAEPRQERAARTERTSRPASTDGDF
jgi:hypothetical protein